MTQHPIAYVDIRFCAHATENIEKVIKAVQNIFPSDYIDEVILEKTEIVGHYGNPIIFFKTRIKNKEIVRELIQKLSVNLSSFDKKKISTDINLFVDKGSFYFRLDKQAAYQKKFKLVTSDPIRIRIRFKNTKNYDVIKICREIGMLI
ncbi:hypothetical protein KJN74_03850 [Candidatus Bathyarchaeota archaeon]|nr:hypothetical protein [Candidatus Bathyarchaeota archaeon]